MCNTAQEKEIKGLELSISSAINNAVGYYILIFVLYIIVTNFSIPVINTLFVIITLFLGLYLPFEKAICLYPLLLVYFGYTFMPMNTLIPFSFDNTTFEKFYFICVGIKVILSHPRLYISRSGKNSLAYLIFGAYMVLSHILKFQLVDAFYLISVIAVFLELKSSKKGLFNFLTFLLFTLISVYAYNVINMANNIASFEGAINLIGWRVNQFRGVRDPNNFALYCNFAIAGLLFSGMFDNKYRKYCIAILAIGVIITISFSGFITLAFIYLYHLFRASKTISKARSYFIKRAVALLFVIIIILSFNSILSILQNSNIGSLSATANRFSTIYSAYQSGNMDIATSYRSFYWNSYLTEFGNMNTFDKLFGDKYLLNSTIEKIGNASHNAYLDYCFNYGIIGLALYLVVAAKNLYFNYKNNESFSFLMVGIMLANFYFRSISGSLLFLPLFI